MVSLRHPPKKQQKTTTTKNKKQKTKQKHNNKTPRRIFMTSVLPIHTGTKATPTFVYGDTPVRKKKSSRAAQGWGMVQGWLRILSRLQRMQGVFMELPSSPSQPYKFNVLVWDYPLESSSGHCSKMVSCGDSPPKCAWR